MSISVRIDDVRGELAAAPADRFVMAIRLKGYLGDHSGALVLADEACRNYPDHARLLAIRGEKRLLVRDLDGAIDDLERAARLPLDDADEPLRAGVESDVIALVLGRPAADVPPSPIARNRPGGRPFVAQLHRHLGIANFVLGRYDDAAGAFSTASAAAPDHSDAMIADWHYLALCRAGRRAEAGAHLGDIGCWLGAPDVADLVAGPGLDGSRTGLVLDAAYRQRLHLYRGDAAPEALLRVDVSSGLATTTLGQGVAAWYRLHGYDDAARRCLQRVLNDGDPVSYAGLAAERDAAALGLDVIPWCPPDLLVLRHAEPDTRRRTA